MIRGGSYKKPCDLDTGLIGCGIEMDISHYRLSNILVTLGKNQSDSLSNIVDGEPGAIGPST